MNAICEYLVSTPETVSMSIPLVKSQVEGFKTSNIETLTEGRKYKYDFIILIKTRQDKTKQNKTNTF